MTDQDFLREIIANKADDGPRLIYADWLDSQGRSERAELIRVQIEAAQIGKSDWKTEVIAGRWGKDNPLAKRGEYIASLWARARELLTKRDSRRRTASRVWAGTLASFSTVHRSDEPFKYDRGFISLAMPQRLEEWMKYGPAAVRQQPIERVVAFDKRPFGTPMNLRGNPNYSPTAWYWTETPDAPAPLSSFGGLQVGAQVPVELFKIGGLPYTRFDSEAAAMTALSDAAIKWAEATRAAR